MSASFRRAGRISLTVATVCLLGWLGQPVAAQEPVPVGGQFLVNSYITSTQLSPAVAVDAAGDFVVVWQSFGSDSGDTSFWSVQGQRYSSGGSALGSQFQVNSFTTSSQRYPAVAVDAAGDFVVVWHSDGSDNGDTSSFSIQGQRYSSGGGAVGPQFLVNSYTTSNQTYPAVAVDPDGDFVVVWQSYGSDNGDTSSYSIQGQRYSSGGTALGPEFLVNSFTPNAQSSPAVAVDAAGDFVVVWNSNGSNNGDTSSFSIQGQRYSSGGSILGGQFLVNSYTTSNQSVPAVAVDPDGDFVVVWRSDGSDNGDTSSFSVQGQRYASGGSALGSQFQINSYTTDVQTYPAVAVDPDGDFVVVWNSNGSNNGDTSSFSIQGQRYSSDGSALGSQFLVNSYTTSHQLSPAVAVDPDGDFVVVWRSYGSDNGDTSSFSVQGQRYVIPDPLFTDGFESGNTTAWSSSVP